MSIIRHFVKEWREQVVRDQSRDEHAVYTCWGLLEDKKPMSSVALLILVDDEHIMEIHNKLTCTNCQPMASMEIKVTYL
jgi:hypothetical protein